MIEVFEGRSLINFTQKFDTDEKCKKYLADLKWKNGFQCPKCGHCHAWEGKPFTKVCKNCRMIVSATSQTLFHKLKFGLPKAFLILFEMSCTTKSCSSTVIAAKYGITQKTAWLFMTKVRRAMNENDPTNGNYKIATAIIGDKSDSHTGRGPGSRKTVQISIESTGKYGIKRGYAQDLTRKNLSNQVTGKKDTTSLQVRRFTKGIKQWIAGVHHQVSRHYLQGYLDEYSFRFNRNRKKAQLFHLLVSNMMMNEPAPYKILYNT